MIGTVLKSRTSLRCLPCLFGGLALAGAALAQQSQPASALDAAHHARTTYRVINLAPDFPVGDVRINAKDQVAYALDLGQFGPIRAYFYDGRTSRDIGNLGSDFARVTGLNDASQVVGVSRNTAGDIRSFIWSRYRGMTDLGTLPGATQTWEPAVNNHGVVTGYADGPSVNPHAFRWSATDGMQDLGVLAQGPFADSYGRAINDAGMITGEAWKSGNDAHAFLWTRGSGMVDIDTIDAGDSRPVAISAHGQVAGNYFYGGDDVRGFVWTHRGGMRDLGTGGGTGTWVNGMSPSGRVYGFITTATGGPRAMTWTRESGLVALGTFGGSTSTATSANNRGQVVGAATTTGDAEYRAFVWNAREGKIDLNTRLRHAPAGLRLNFAVAISDTGSIVALSNAGLVLLKPDTCRCGHAVGPIAGAQLVAVGMPFDASVSFASGDPAAAPTVSWSWGDGNVERARNASARTGAGSATGSHVYATPGIYTVTATVTDAAGNSAAVSRSVVVYSPSSGFVGGAGSFASQYLPARHRGVHGGVATFSFFAPSSSEARTAGGEAQLHFNVAGLNFRSKEMRTVSIQGTRAQFEGSGTLNGTGDYRFSMATQAGASAGQDQAARLSLKIWHVDPVTKAQVVDYDSAGRKPSIAAGAALVEGRIAVRQ